ncbi:type II toxin-antitoxin system VapC family toxin [Novosphingobium sp. KACC 22771]|uniref:type II toxin-antitoxin system VapC family toxin n=1 Tax=Novosphingobium sp. KACC 22771 TaxID=3025670 RepID=UPI002367395A|nr:type II toxin-antitoxin system VapC family toxin [Novosphingobium sp. KACC 22771]WDF74216.1 type II toxin-antitoxin system VapC family toxin [Novosphingobium sp. KACC 22771]
MTDGSTSPIYVLDASALLCLLFDEPGADLVEARLTRALVSAVNYHEVLAKLTDRGVEAVEAKAMLAELDIDIIAVDRQQADIGGEIQPLIRSAGLSLGDRSCLALARSRQAVAITADQIWRGLDIGVAVEVVR